MKHSRVLPSWKRPIACAVTAFTMLGCPSRVCADSPGQDGLQGPTALLNDLGNVKAFANEPTPLIKLRRDIKAYSESSSSLPAAEAAARWLSLADRETVQIRQSDGNFGFHEILEVLPPVSAWNELAAAIEKRSASNPPTCEQAVLRMLAARLTLDARAETQAKEQAIESFLAVTRKAEGMDRKAVEIMIESTLYFPESDPGRQLEFFSQSLSALERASDNVSQQSIDVPDLVSFVGREAARPLLHRVLLLQTSRVNFSQGKETLALAREIALESIAELKVPHWNLCDSLGTGELFSAMEKRFPRKPIDGPPKPEEERMFGFDDGYSAASAYEMFDLILAGRPAEASVRATSLTDDNIFSGLAELVNQGRAPEVASFMSQLLAGHPELPLWDSYIHAAAEAGRSDEALQDLRNASLSKNLSAEQRSEIGKSMAAALLAADKLDEGIAELERTVRIPWMAKPAVAKRHSTADRIFSAATQLARLGVLLGNPDLVEEGTVAVRNMPAEWASDEANELVTFASVLIRAKRYSDAEKITDDAIRNLVAQHLASGLSVNNGSFSYTIPSLFSVLVEIYSVTGHSDDVLLVLDKAPYWNQRDVTSLGGISGQNIGFEAAEALAATGRTAEARRVLDYVLGNSGGYDPAYVLMIKLYGAEAMAKLDALALADRFEERPLIWKAELQRRAGKLVEAEATARTAIAIDPSDGEEPHGDRMRAYGVLSATLADKGDAKQAQFYLSVVKAIRLSEQADDFHEAGLLRRAIKMYSDALVGFSDAYCIQSRLAVQLNDLGRFAEAEEHYRKAYELMPNSFGRVESHCFGCEKAFGPVKAQAIAERVFISLSKTTPNKPQVHYLLGYLRTEQDRYAEALPEFQRAVQLDPDYLNAWKKILEIDGQMFVSDVDRDATVLNILRLDPYGRHSAASMLKVHDLRGVFGVAEKMRSSANDEPANVYPLKGSIAEADRLQKEAEARHEYFQIFEYPMNGGHPLSAREIVRTNHFLQGITSLMDLSVSYAALLNGS